MKQNPRLIDVLYRAETGPIMDEADFERGLLGPEIKKLAQKYDIRYTGEEIINCNDDLADRVFQAALDLAGEVGVFNQSTSRRILWSREEIENDLKSVPSVASLGNGEQQFLITSRKPTALAPTGTH